MVRSRLAGWPPPSRASRPAGWPRRWTWAATRPPGRCCTASAGPWSLRPTQAGRPGRDRDGCSPGRPDWPAESFPSAAAIALEDRGGTPGRVRMQRLPSGAGDELVAFLGRGSGGAGDAGPGRAPGDLVAAGRARLHDSKQAPSLTHLPAVERALARWLRGTHRGATSPTQLDWYLDEFTFRFNRHSSTHRGLLFYRLLEEAVVTPPQPYRRVVGTPTYPQAACALAAPIPLLHLTTRERSEHAFDLNIYIHSAQQRLREGKPWTGPPCWPGPVERTAPPVEVAPLDRGQVRFRLCSSATWRWGSSCLLPSW